MLDPLDYITAGNSTFTIQSLKTGNHFTFRVQTPKDKTAPHFVSVLTACEDGKYAFIGTIFEERIFRSKNMRSKCVMAFDWFWSHLCNFEDQAKFIPSGKCCRCGRQLTTPESVEMGIGPECATKV